MTRILGPIPCISCKKSVWWDRVGTDLRLMEGRGAQAKAHDCEEWIDSRLPKTPSKIAA